MGAYEEFFRSDSVAKVRATHPFEVNWVKHYRALFDKLTKVWDKDYAEKYPDLKLYMHVRYFNEETKQVSDKPHGNSASYGLNALKEHTFTTQKRVFKRPKEIR